MRFTCQKLYMFRRRCDKPIFRNNDECLWHYLMGRVRDRTPYPTLVGQFLIGLGVAALAAIIFIGVSRPFSNAGFAVTAQLVLAALALRWFTKGVIVFDYPLSDFRWLMQGLLAASFACLIFLPWSSILLSKDYATIKAIIGWLGNLPTWIHSKAAGVILVLLLGTVLYGSATLIVEDLFNRRSRYVRFFLLALPALVFGPVVGRIQQGEKTPAEVVTQAHAFWAPVLGGVSTNWIWGTAFVLFNVCEFLNIGIRRAQRSDELFQNTFMISFPICWGTPFLALCASRELMMAMRVKGLVAFFFMASILNVGICIVATLMAVQQTRRHR